jgi:hypothetical protein
MFNLDIHADQLAICNQIVNSLDGLSHFIVTQNKSQAAYKCSLEGMYSSLTTTYDLNPKDAHMGANQVSN